ncbi:Bug family tripartite tricarboxylate transporter substrate binding protein [Hydrogenophaga sp.]|jgi:tripartite-type tricarboxylate transporter receptor subunit TctC|uniref:Bug family tripartite tricarboxylate transporter substrate binding protein n=1 Tax=Hydrogenophaga sp. TaxID=1904254 RepID=UPI00391BCC38
MNFAKRALLATLASLPLGMAFAQDAFPSRPITIVVPYPAGGTSDSQVRMIQEPLQKLLGQPVVVDNKPGASGAIAAQAVARAKADGYTLLYPNNGLLIAPLLNRQAGYEPLRDFKPVSVTTSVPMVLVANKGVPANNLNEFLQYAKAQANGIMYASAGTASYGHLASTRFSQMANLKVNHVPYRGEANTTMAVRTGEVQMLLTTPSPAMLGLVSQGQLTMLGVATDKPSPVVPGVPTIASVLPGFTAEVWFGLLAPAGTPDDVVNKLNAAVKKVMADETIRNKMLASGAVPRTTSSTEFMSLMTRETVMWSQLIAKHNIRAD